MPSYAVCYGPTTTSPSVLARLEQRLSVKISASEVFDASATNMSYASLIDRYIREQDAAQSHHFHQQYSMHIDVGKLLQADEDVSGHEASKDSSSSALEAASTPAAGVADGGAVTTEAPDSRGPLPDAEFTEAADAGHAISHSVSGPQPSSRPLGSRALHQLGAIGGLGGVFPLVLGGGALGGEATASLHPHLAKQRAVMPMLQVQRADQDAVGETEPASTVDELGDDSDAVLAVEMVGDAVADSGDGVADAVSPAAAAATTSVSTAVEGESWSKLKAQLKVPHPLRFFVIDCRSIDDFESGHLPTAFHFDPDLLLNPEDMQNILEGFKGMMVRIQTTKHPINNEQWTGAKREEGGWIGQHCCSFIADTEICLMCIAVACVCLSRAATLPLWASAMSLLCIMLQRQRKPPSRR